MRHVGLGIALLVASAPDSLGQAGDASAPGGPVVRDGVLEREGSPYRAFGMNVRDLADDVLDKGEAATDSFACLRWLGEHRVPFIRFWASYFDNRRKYLEDPERFWQHMDLLVAAAEQANVALAPTLFWDSWNVPWTFDEYCRDWGDGDSRTRQFMERYTREFVTRYRERPIVWLWEFSNENNLMWDLPNTMEFLPEGRRDDRNVARSSVGRASIAAFGEAVRLLDPLRPISSGCSQPRGCQFSLNSAMDGTGVNPWTADTPEQHAMAAGWTAPDPLDLYCIHYYAPFKEYEASEVRKEIGRHMSVAAGLGKPLYIGEFGVLDGDATAGEGFAEGRYRACVADMFAAIEEAHVPLAAWWVYTVKGWGAGMGAVNPQDPRFDYIADLIREANARLGGGAN